MHGTDVATETFTAGHDTCEELQPSPRPGGAVLRADLESSPITGAELLAYYQAGGSGVSEEYLNEVEEASKYDPPPDDPWA